MHSESQTLHLGIYVQKNLATATLVLGSSLLFCSSAFATGIQVLANFDYVNGLNSGTDLTYDSNNVLFYGTTDQGGIYGGGNVFSFNPNDSNPTTALKDVALLGNANGDSPEGNLTYLNGIFYGTTVSGGPNNYGNIFSFNPNDSNPVTALKDVAEFNESNGLNPYGSLTYSSTKGLFYGTTLQGGANSVGHAFAGTVFSVNPTTGNIQNLVSFAGT